MIISTKRTQQPICVQAPINEVILYNVYNKPLTLTQNEIIIVDLFKKYGKEKLLYHDAKECWLNFQCIYCKNNKYGWMINSSGLTTKEFSDAFLHLLINGIIEKDFWKNNNIDVCFRMPIL